MSTNCANCLQMNSEENERLSNCSHTICLNCKLSITEARRLNNLLSVQCKICHLTNNQNIEANDLTDKYAVLSLSNFEIINEYNKAQQNQTMLSEDCITDFTFLNNIRDNYFGNDSSKTKSYVCNDHNKDLDAFCKTDNCLVCIICIVDGGHSLHNLVSIQKGYDEIKEALQHSFDKSSKSEQEIVSIKSVILEQKAEIRVMLEQRLKDISSLFQSFRDILESQERKITDKIVKDFSHEISKLNIIESGISNQLYVISMLNKNKRVLLEVVSELSLLSESQELLKRLELANIPTPKIKPIGDQSFPALNEKQILNELISALKQQEAVTTDYSKETFKSHLNHDENSVNHKKEERVETNESNST